MVCPKCKNENTEESVFCQNCGNKIKGTSSKLQEGNQSSKKNSKLFILLGGIVLFVIIIVGIFIYNDQPSVKYNKAEKAFQSEDYEKAAMYYEKAGIYKDANEKFLVSVQADHYSKGEEAFLNKEYDIAIEEYIGADGYKNSANMILQCYYGKGVLLKEQAQYLEAAECFSLAGSYEDSEYMIIALGRESVESGNYQEAVDIFEFALNSESNPYAQYAMGMKNFEAKAYVDASTNFINAGNVLDAPEKKRESSYYIAKTHMDSGNYKAASDIFSTIKAFGDAEELGNACKLLNLESEINKGNLNTAFEELQQLPVDFAYNDIKASDLMDKLNNNNKWVEFCGTWESSSGVMESDQNGSYGYSRGWQADIGKGAVSIDVKCILQNDGSVKLTMSGSIPIYTNYSSISQGLKSESKKINIEEYVTEMGSITYDENTTVTFDTNGIKVNYKKSDNSHDVYFTYVYKTAITFGTKK